MPCRAASGGAQIVLMRYPCVKTAIARKLRLKPLLHVEPEMHDIAFLNDVLLAFESQPTRLFSALLTVTRNEVIVSNHFSPDEAILEIRVNLARRLWSCRAHLGSPGPNFFFAGRKVSLQSKQFKSRANHSIETRLIKAEILEENDFIFIIQQSDLRLDRCTNCDNSSAIRFRVFHNRVEMRIIRKASLVNVGNKHDGLVRDHLQAPNDWRFLLINQKRTNGQSFGKVIHDFL